MLTKEQVLLGATLYMLLVTIENNSFIGKRLIKKINRTLKKELAIYRNSVELNEYNKLIYEADAILKEVLVFMKENIKDDNNIITPGPLLRLIKMKYSDVIKPYNIKDEWINELMLKYNMEDRTFYTIKYANRLMDKIKEHIR